MARHGGQPGPAAASRSAGYHRSENCDETGRRRRHRLQKDQRRLSHGPQKVPDPQPCRARRRQSCGTGQSPRGRIRPSRASRRMRYLRIPRSKSSSTSRRRRRMSRPAPPAIAAGKLVHSGKPLGVTVREARSADRSRCGLVPRLGSALDTFLGEFVFLIASRRADRRGLIGRPIGGAAFFFPPGPPAPHPNPPFYYLAGPPDA